MTTSQVARALGVSADTVRRWVKAGRLRPITPANPLLRRPKSLRFRREDVEALRQA